MSEYTVKNSKQVKLSDRVRYRCKRCGKCCRNVNGVVFIESLDAWRMAKELGISVMEFYETYTDHFFFGDTIYPLFALKTVGRDDHCIFLNGKRCSVQAFKPRTCKIYPFWVEVGDTPNEFIYNFSTEYQHHPKPSVVKVHRWMKEHMTEDDKLFLSKESLLMKKFAPLFNSIRNKSKDNSEVLRSIILFRYYFFETDEPFFEQYDRNNEMLLSEFERILASLEV